jgi:hypothetical protein
METRRLSEETRFVLRAMRTGSISVSIRSRTRTFSISEMKGRSPMSPAPKGNGSQFLPGRVAVAGALAGLFCASLFLLPARGAESSVAIPQLMLPPTAGWAGGFTGRIPAPETYLPDDYLHSRANIERALSLGALRDKVTEFLAARSLNEFIPPASGIGPISDGPEHPFYNNPMRAVVGKNGTYRVADLTSEAAKNLMPWAIEALKKQNALALAERTVRRARRDVGS